MSEKYTIANLVPFVRDLRRNVVEKGLPKALQGALEASNVILTLEGDTS